MRQRIAPSGVCRSSLLIAAMVAMTSCSTEEPVVDPAKAPSESPSASPANAAMTAPEAKATTDGIYSLKTTSLAGQEVDLATYSGKVSLVVNVASRCGYTGQYTGLQKLHDELKDRGFAVLGFPCNDFGGQEPGSAEEIRSFCTDRYSVTFPMFDKVAIKGDAPSPIYQRLIAGTEETPSWNFCKYLVGKDGRVLGFWKSGTRPDDAELRAAIEKAL